MTTCTSCKRGTHRHEPFPSSGQDAGCVNLVEQAGPDGVTSRVLCKCAVVVSS